MSNGEDAAQEFVGGEIAEAADKIKGHSFPKCEDCPTREGVQRMNWVPLATAIIIALVEALR